jgi:hypothetical protein
MSSTLPPADFNAAALCALDAFQCSVDARVFVDFRETLPHPHNPRKEPMGWVRMRGKIHMQAYASHADWTADVHCLFSRFADEPLESVRRRMADVLRCLFHAPMRAELFGSSVELESELEHWRDEAKKLEPAYIAD